MKINAVTKNIVLTQFHWLGRTLAVLALIIAPLAHADIVVNGGFEAGDLSGWTVSDSLIAADNVLDLPYYQPKEGTWWANLGTIPPMVGSLSQTLPTLAGNHYQVSFWLKYDGDANASFQANWNGTPLITLGPGTAFDYTKFEFNVSATASDTLLEFKANNEIGDWLLDNVSAVPEPQTWLMGLFTMVGLGGFFARSYLRRQ
jgi:flagellin